MSQPDTHLNRRSLLKAAGAVGILSGLATLTPKVLADKTDAFDYEADIVCVGSGAAAASAAVTAKSLGVDVIVLEKMPMAGGTTAKSGGVTWIANNPLMQAQDIKDERLDCLKYMARYAFPEDYTETSPTLGLAPEVFANLEAFYDNGEPMVRWMEQIGAVKFRPFKMWDVNSAAPDYGDTIAQNKVHNARAMEPAVGSGSAIGGGSLALQLEQWLIDNGVSILLEHKVTDLIKDANRVVGVTAEHAGKTLRIKARRGVIFGTGGFAHNQELIRLHQPGIYGACAAVGSTGDFIEIAQRAGAKMGPLATAWRTPVVLEQALENRAVPHGVFFAPGDSMVHVNKYGMRVVNEKRNYNDRTRAHFVFDPVTAEYPNRLMFMVFDERSLDRYAGALPIPADKRESSWLIEANTPQALANAINQRLEKLEPKLGHYRLAPSFADNLKASLTRFNGFAETGIDLDFNRGGQEYDVVWNKLFSPASANAKFPANDKPNPTMHPIELNGSLYAVILAPGALDTNAGPAINAHAQVLAANGEPIAGLYGAGNCIASPSGPAYLGAGGTIGLAMTFGYIAARHALGKA